MPRFSRTSKARLGTCDERLQKVFKRVIKDYDCTIVIGHRGEEAQNRAKREGRSSKAWPDSRHNTYPSKAVDAAPYDPRIRNIDWNTDWRTREGRANKLRFYEFAGRVKGIASMMGYRIRWGGDWDGDTFFDDQTFNDLVHFEIVD